MPPNPFFNKAPMLNSSLALQQRGHNTTNIKYMEGNHYAGGPPGTSSCSASEAALDYETGS